MSWSYRGWQKFDAGAMGAFQGGILAGIPAFLVLFATDHMFLAAEMGAIVVLSFIGWARYGFKWHPWNYEDKEERNADQT